MQRPTAAPRMPASASGVSKQRSAPKRSRRPAVARKTPPARPTSSPMTITSESRSSSTWNASLIASTMLSSAKDPPQLREVRPERRRPIRHGLDEGRTASGTRALDGLARRLVDREHVTAVDANTRHPVADSLVGERLRARLRGQRRRDRPLVVVAEEDERRLRDGG